MESNCETKKSKRIRLECDDWDWSDYAEPINTKVKVDYNNIKSEIPDENCPSGNTFKFNTNIVKTEPKFTQPIGCPSEWDCGTAPIPDSTTNDTTGTGTSKKKKKKNKLNTVDSRVSFQLAPGDVLVQCPYKICHLILETRFLTHLNKCRTNYLKECAKEEVDVEIGICQWNAAHHLHFSKLAEHEANCQDQAGVAKIVRHFADWDESTAIVQYGKRNAEADWEDDDDYEEPTESQFTLMNSEHSSPLDLKREPTDVDLKCEPTDEEYT